MGKIADFNNSFADRLADWLSDMAMFYALVFLICLPLFWQKPQGLVAWTQYVVSVFFQGVALPVLAFVAKKEGNKTTKLLQETHDATMAELSEIKSLHTDLHNAILKINEVDEEIDRSLGKN